MKDLLFSTLKGYKKEYLPKDIFSGIIMAAVSIPISMGYAQIAGLPAVYGLYGSVFPILFFALFSTSRQFIFGVDAAPAAIVGAALVSLGIENGSKEAIQYVPVIALLYINTGYGRIYQWDCAYDHFNADPEDIRRESRIRGTSGTYQTYCTDR